MDRYDEQAANIVNQSALLQNYPAAGKHVAGMIASALRAAAGVQEKSDVVWCDICPHPMYLHNPDGTCGCGMDCATRREAASTAVPNG